MVYLKAKSGGENIKSLDSKIKELSDKIANLNVSEREKEDNIKAHVNNIFKSEKNENVNLDKSSNNNNNQINLLYIFQKDYF